MNVQGIGGKAAQIPAASAAPAGDSRIQAYQQQITQLQQRLQELAQNKDLTAEEKMKKRQEINQQIHTVEQQMRQAQREIRQERQKEKNHNSIDEMVSTPQKNGADSMSSNKMRSIIAGGQAMKQADGSGKLSKEMEGKARVLAGEIAVDQQRGIDTGKKEEELIDLEQRTDAVKSDAIKTAAEVADEIQEADEKERTEKNETSKEMQGTDAGNLAAEEVVSKNIQVHVNVRL